VGFCWILVLAPVGLDSWCAGLLLVYCLAAFWLSQWWYPMQTSLWSWFVGFWFCLVWFCLVWLVYFVTFLCPSCVDLFSWLGVQGGHSFEPIYWLFAVGDLFALLLTAPQHWSLAVLVYPDSCEGKCFMISFVVKGGLSSGCAGMQSSPLSTKAPQPRKPVSTLVHLVGLA